MADVIGGGNEALQQNLDRSAPAIFASYRIIGAILLCGGGGYAVDRWLTTGPYGVLLGLIVGIVAGLYGVIRAGVAQQAEYSTVRPVER